MASVVESAGISSAEVFDAGGKLKVMEAHVKDEVQDPLLADQSTTANRRKEDEDMLLPQPDSNISHHAHRRSEPQV